MGLEVDYLVIVTKSSIVVTTRVNEVHLKITLNTCLFAQDQRVRVDLVVLSCDVSTTGGFTNNAAIWSDNRLGFVVGEMVAVLLIAVHFTLIWALLR